ncbi:Ppx/GppA family phosphatase [Sneathiella chungangensis]|uniref:Ppx/GppA family phosphatase n=1 Tax=Sneathiella chungangensis TaxID=1418234 RepID=A0A845MC53_9PROT|nr:Ppx/GppA family phosphatase [Sneathiella chungangensis]
MATSQPRKTGKGDRRRYRRKFQHGGPGNPETFGALDLGTNNCRLLIAKQQGKSFRVIDSFSRIVRLGEGVSLTGKLSGDAMERTIDALGVCADKMRRAGVTHMRCVATEVCRKADNSDEFLDRVREGCGIELDIITTAEEAALAAEGCAPLIDYRHQNALVFDIGGGSTELVWLGLEGRRQSEVLGWTSIPVGVVTLTERHGGMEVSQSAYADMIADVRHHVDAFEAEHGIAGRIREGRVQMLGTSGTVTTLAGVHFGLERYSRRRIDGAWLNAGAMLDICRRLAGSDYKTRVLEPCIGEERADLVVSGCAIVEAMHSRWPVKKLRVADRGLREGMLLGMIERVRRERQLAAEERQRARQATAEPKVAP